MSRAASWAGALAGLALLTFFCARCHGPVIEADLAASTAAALGGDALDNVAVSMDGRDVTLTGVVDSDDDRRRFGALAARVRGVRAVDNRLRLPGEPDPDAPGSDAEGPEASPAFALTDEGGGLTVRGTVADEATKASLLARVAQAFPSRDVTDGLTVDAGADPAWHPSVSAVLGVLGELPSGTLAEGGLAVEPDGEGGVLVLSGRVPDAAAKAQAEAAAEAAVEAPFAFRSALTVGTAESAAAVAAAGTQIETAAPGNADVAAVQAALRELFVPDDRGRSGAVEFETGTSRLTDDSRDLLDAASGILRRTSGVSAEIQGHTDDEGSAASNLRLSEQRADAVRRYLSEAGVERSRLTVRGVGEAEPVASNDTPEGRARNRRVVFRLDAE